MKILTTIGDIGLGILEFIVSIVFIGLFITFIGLLLALYGWSSRKRPWK